MHRNICTAKCCGEWSKSALQIPLCCSWLPSPAHHSNSNVVKRRVSLLLLLTGILCWWMCRLDSSMCLPNWSSSTVMPGFSFSLSRTLLRFFFPPSVFKNSEGEPLCCTHLYFFLLKVNRVISQHTYHWAIALIWLERRVKVNHADKANRFGWWCEVAADCQMSLPSWPQ